MKEFSQKIIQGSFWVLSLQVFQKSLALLRTLILARLLAPEDFGLFALASLMILAFEVFTRTGFEDALIHFRTDLESYLHTSYWIQVLRGLILAILCLVLAPLMGNIFHEPVVIKIAQFMALTQLVRGFRSVGIVLLQREMNFKRETQFNLVNVIVSFIATIGFSLLLKNVWGMVYGFFIGELIATIFSFYIHPYRPRFEFHWQKVTSLWNYGVWLFLSGIVSYLALNLDKIFIGRLLDAKALGYYYMAFYIANLPTAEITKQIGRVTQPAYAKIQDDSVKLIQSFRLILRYSIIFQAPIAISLAILAPKYTSIFLGENWSEASVPLAILAIGGLLRSSGGLGASFFKATSEPKQILVIEFFRALSLICLLYFGFQLAGLVGIAVVSTISSFVVLIATTVCLKRKIINFDNSIFLASFPYFPIFLMGTSVYILSQLLSVDILSLLFISLIGILIYGVILIISDKKLLNPLNELLVRNKYY